MSGRPRSRPSRELRLAVGAAAGSHFLTTDKNWAKAGVRATRQLRRPRRLRRASLVAAALAGTFAWGAAAAQPADAASGAPATVELGGTGDPHAGHVTLAWEPAPGNAAGWVFQLEEGAASDFSDASLRYEGPHRSSVVSGLANGERHFRARARRSSGGQWGPWSAPFTFRTEHHSLGLASGLFGLGAVVFALTAGFVVLASRREENSEATPASGDGRG